MASVFRVSFSTVPVLRLVSRWIVAADRFVRLHLLFFTALWPLLGATTLRRDLTTSEVAALLAVAICFHVYAYVLNDVIDLRIDRTQPSRQADLLVRGVIRPWQALVFAFAQPVMALVLTLALGGSVRAHLTLCCGFAFMGAYNLWGKRCAFPPLTDFVQGLGWGSLAMYAPYGLSSEPTPLTWLVAAYVTVLIVLINGIHGSLRDLDNDVATGARTTAILLGARSAPGRAYPCVPALLATYASFLLAMLIGISAVVVIRNDFGYAPSIGMFTAAIVGALNIAAVILQRVIVRPRGPGWDGAWRLQLYVMVLSVPIAFLPQLNGVVLVTLLLLNALSLALFGCSSRVARWTIDAIRTTLRVPRARRFPSRALTD